MSRLTLLDLLDRYQGRVSCPGVSEDSGGRFDLPLVVDGLEIACVNLRHPNGVQIYRDADGNVAAMAPDGSIVPLPQVVEMAS